MTTCAECTCVALLYFFARTPPAPRKLTSPVLGKTLLRRDTVMRYLLLVRCARVSSEPLKCLAVTTDQHVRPRCVVRNANDDGIRPPVGGRALLSVPIAHESRKNVRCHVIAHTRVDTHPASRATHERLYVSAVDAIASDPHVVCDDVVCLCYSAQTRRRSRRRRCGTNHCWRRVDRRRERRLSTVVGGRRARLASLEPRGSEHLRCAVLIWCGKKRRLAG